MSAIAMKGFLAGYMEKTAEMPAEAMPGHVRGAAPAKEAETADEASRLSAGAVQTGGTDVPAAPPSAADNYGALRGMLKSWMGPAAIGAGAVGAGSIGMDMLRKKKRVAAGKKPVDVKRALLLSVGLGIPLVVASSILYKQGLPGFGQAAGIAGRAGMSAGKGVASKTMELAGKGWDKTKELTTQGLAKGKDVGTQVASRVMKGPQPTK